MALVFVPPGGHAGAAQMTRATIHTMRKAFSGKKSGDSSGAARTTRRARAGSVVRKKAKRAKRGSSSKQRAWMTKGSSAAKRHMAKLRRMRKKKR